MKYYGRLSVIALLAIAPLYGFAQEKVVPIKYGDMDQWIIRKVHESGVIGGNTKLLYEIGPTKEIDGNKPYKNMGGSPWGTSNVMAKVVGIVKTNNSVYRDKRDNGYCARLETHIESVKVLGMVNITVLAAGSIYLGDMLEPITGTKNAEKNMNWGVPFTQRPKAVRYDYKVKMSGEKDRIRLTGFSKKGQVAGQLVEGVAVGDVFIPAGHGLVNRLGCGEIALHIGISHTGERQSGVAVHGVASGGPVHTRIRVIHILVVA